MSQTDAKRAVKGNTVVSFDENAPRALVARIMKQYPTAGRDEIVRRTVDAVNGKDHAYLQAFIAYGAINAYNAIVKLEREPDEPRATAHVATTTTTTAAAASVTTLPPRPRPVVSPEQARADQHARSERAKAMVETVKQLLLLDLTAPNGKPYRDATKSDMVQFGAWQAKLASKMKAGDTVGSRFTEADLRKAQTWSE